MTPDSTPDDPNPAIENSALPAEAANDSTDETASTSPLTSGNATSGPETGPAEDGRTVQAEAPPTAPPTYQPTGPIRSSMARLSPACTKTRRAVGTSSCR